MERVMGFEPTTVCLGSRYATTASHPLSQGNYIIPIRRRKVKFCFVGACAVGRGVWRVPPNIPSSRRRCGALAHLAPL